MKKKRIRQTKNVLLIVFAVLAVIIGLLSYRVFMSYYPGVNWNDLIKAKTGLSAQLWFSLSAGLLVAVPLLLVALSIYEHFAFSYVSYLSDHGVIFLSDRSMESFITDVVSEMAGVEAVDVSVEIFKENKLGIRIWLDTDEKNDFVRFAERVQQRVLQDLDFNFGIKKIRHFQVYVESTNILAGNGHPRVQYR